MDKPATSTLLAQPTSFIGRTHELVELKALLVDPSCRLITLAGPGGTGKTRLSIEAARLYGGEFPDGAVYVALQPVASTEFLVPAIAAELGLTLRGGDHPASQLFAYLADRQLLLVLDNFEHIIDAAEFLADMLAAAPSVKLLVSSREALNLSGEQVFNLAGLSFPDESAGAGVEWYDSVRLFVDRATRVKRDFASAEHWETIARICRLVQGTPLAVELAATWVKALSPAEIAAEIERNLDFLSTSVRNVPERHRSVRAVFEESWRLLTDDAERDALARLSVFGGSFERKAAEVVGGAGLRVLSGLIEKSLLRALPDGRYQLHTLLNQYAGEKLVASPEAVEEARDAHSKYYLGLLQAIGAGILRDRQIESSAAISPEMDNMRAAWQRAVDRADSDTITGIAFVLGQCCQFKARYVEGAALFAYAVEGLEKLPKSPHNDFALANCLVQGAWFEIRLGRIDDAAEYVRRSGEIMERLKMDPLPGFASDYRLPAGIIATIRGNYAEAADLGERSRAVAAKKGDQGNEMLAEYVIGRAAFLQGDIEGAYKHISRAAATTGELGERWFRGYCLIELGNVALARREIGEASKHYQAAYHLREEFDDPEGMAVALTYLGEVSLDSGEAVQATAYYDRALAIYVDIHDKGGLATALGGAARAAAAQQQWDHAREHLREGLIEAAGINHLPQVIALLGLLGAVQLAEGDEGAALPLLCVALYHPSSDHETRSRVEGLGDISARLEQCDVAAAVETVTRVLNLESDLGIGRLLAAPSAGLPRAYPDGLTDREVDVLRLLAAGKSNQQIAGELFITPNTVANHVKNILSKTQTANRTEAAAYALSHGLA